MTEPETTPPEPTPGRLMSLVGTFWLLPRIFDRRRGLQWAAALSFHTLLSLVPLMIIGLSLLAYFEDEFNLETGFEQMLLDRGLPDAAAQAGDVIRSLVDRVRSASAGIGAVGFAFLLYTALGLFTTLEIACNSLWEVPRDRHILHRLRNFAATVILGPILAGLSLYATAKLQLKAIELRDQEYVGPALRYAVLAAPFFLTWLAFYVFITLLPNTKVRATSALLGTLVAGSAWEVAKWGFNLYVAYSTQIDKLYGPLGILPLFVIWVQVTWIIALIGVTIASVHQDYPELAAGVRRRRQERRARRAA